MVRSVFAEGLGKRARTVSAGGRGIKAVQAPWADCPQTDQRRFFCAAK